MQNAGTQRPINMDHSFCLAVTVTLQLLIILPSSADDCPDPDQVKTIVAGDPRVAASAAVASGDGRCLDLYVTSEGTVALRKVDCGNRELTTAPQAATQVSEACSLTQLLELVGADRFADQYNAEVMRRVNGIRVQQ
jgi:hypothetical protein